MGEIGIPILLAAYIVGLGLLVAELFVPGLIAGSIGILLVIVSIIGIIIESPTMGLMLLGFTFVFGAILIRIALRRFTLGESLSRAKGYSASSEDLPKLLGLEGISLTTLRPAGMAEFNGERIDVVTSGEMLSKDTRIKVIEVEGNRVVVKALDVTE